MSNIQTGQIAGLQGRLQKRTLSNYCHDKEATLDGTYQKGCPLYNTKPENVPDGLAPHIEKAEEMKELKALELLPTLDKITCYEFECYRAAEAASTQVEAENAMETLKKTRQQSSGNTISTPLGVLGEEGEDSAMSNW